MSTFILVIGALFAGFCATAALLPLVLKLAVIDGVIDRPDQRRIHKMPIPRAGGVAVLGGIVFSTSAAMYSGAVRGKDFTDLKLFAAVLVGTAIIAAVGLYDDIVGLRPWKKLVGQSLATVVVFLLGVKIERISGVRLPLSVDFIVTLGWFLLVTNAFNLIDGLDGLASSLGVVSSLGLLVHLLMRGAGDEAMVVAGLLGALGAFLRWNLPPARLFLGDTGSNTIGYMLALLIVIACGNHGNVPGWWVPFFIVGIPFVDTMLAIWRRSVRYLLNKRSGLNDASGVFSADLDHIHHRVGRRGFKTLHVVCVLCTAQLVLVCTSAAATVWGDMWSVVPVVTFGAVLILLCCVGGLLEARLTKELVLSILKTTTPIKDEVGNSSSSAKADSLSENLYEESIVTKERLDKKCDLGEAVIT